MRVYDGFPTLTIYKSMYYLYHVVLKNSKRITSNKVFNSSWRTGKLSQSKKGLLCRISVVGEDGSAVSTSNQVLVIKLDSARCLLSSVDSLYSLLGSNAIMDRRFVSNDIENNCASLEGNGDTLKITRSPRIWKLVCFQLVIFLSNNMTCHFFT